MTSLAEFRFHHLVLLAAGGILAIASTYHLSASPAIWYDEGFYTQAAENIADFGRQGLQTAPGTLVPTSHVTVGYPLLYPVAASYELFGTSVTSGRAVMVLYIFAFAAAAYALMRTLYGARTAAWSLLLLASFPMLYGNGKSVLGEVPGLFFATLALLAVARFEKGERGLLSYAAIGAAAGLAVATKPIYVLLPVALGLTYLLFYRKSLPLSVSGVASGLAAFFLPLALWAALQFGPGASVASILTYYANPYEVADVVGKAIGNALRFVTETTPLYFLGLMLAWGCAFLVRPKGTRSLSEAGTFAFALLIIAAYLRLEGWYRYLFPGLAFAVAFLVPSLVTLATVIGGRIRALAWAPQAAYACVVVLALFHLYQTAFDSYVAQYYRSTRTEELSAALAALGPEASVFLYDAPELGILLPSRNYYQYIHPQPHIEIGATELRAIAEGRVDFLVVPQDLYDESPGRFLPYAPHAVASKYAILAAP